MKKWNHIYAGVLGWIEKVMDAIARDVLLAVFMVIFVLGFIIKPMYNIDDSPYFTHPDLYDLAAMILVLVIGILVYRFREVLQKRMNCWIGFIAFVVVIGLYIWLVPLRPFSDVKAVVDGALNFASMNIQDMLAADYWNIFPGNIRLSLFWGILLFPFPKSVLTLRAINALMIYGIIAFTRLLAKAYGVKYYNVVYLLLLTFSPLLLYANCVYYDIPLILLCMIGLYLFRTRKTVIGGFVLVGLACYLRKSGKIIMIAMLILYLFEERDMWLNKKWLKKIAVILISLILFWVMSTGMIRLVKQTFITGNYQSYPSSNFYYMGLNEEKFGFQNHDFSYDRTMQDVVDRAVGYGPVRLGKILLKKTFWLWDQGTYQAQRYAFGMDTAVASDKFIYETPVERYLMQDSQVTRRLINAFMRMQYLLLFALMLVTMVKKKNTDRFRIFYYIMMATFLIMLVYELKSRYILYLLPLMTVMAGNGIEELETRLKKS